MLKGFFIIHARWRVCDMAARIGGGANFSRFGPLRSRTAGTGHGKRADSATVALVRIQDMAEYL